MPAQTLTTAIDTERAQNGRRLAALRLLGTSAFLVLKLVLGAGFAMPRWRAGLESLAAYLLGAIAKHRITRK